MDLQEFRHQDARVNVAGTWGYLCGELRVAELTRDDWESIEKITNVLTRELDRVRPIAESTEVTND